MTKIAFFHGLESTTVSDKTEYLQNNFVDVYTPAMDYTKPGLFEEILAEVKKRNIDLLVGSSMGGWFAYCISTMTGIPTLLFNPAFHSRSMEPKVKRGSMKAKHTAVLGKADDVIDPYQSLSWIKTNGVGNFQTNFENNNHRTSIGLFRKWVGKSTINESYRVLRFQDFLNESLNEAVSSSLVREIINDIMVFVKATKDLYQIKGEEAHQFTFNPYKTKDYSEVFGGEITVSCLILREEHGSLQIDASAGEENPNIELVIQIDPNFEPSVYKTLYMKLTDDIRHELEHIEQHEKRPEIFTAVKTRAAINRNPKRILEYFLLPEEIEAMVAGMYNRAKKEKRTLDSVFREYLGYYVSEKLITPSQEKQVITKWTEYANKRFPAAQYDTVKESLLEGKKPKDAPDWHDSDAPDAEGRFKELGIKDLAAWLIKTRKKDLKKISGSITQQIVFNRKKDPEYAEKMEKVRKEVYKQLGRKDLLEGRIHHPDQFSGLNSDGEVECEKCGWSWDMVTGGDDPFNCHDCGHDNSPDLDIDVIQEINI